MYEFYLTEYNGNIIKDLTDFQSVLPEAEAYVDGFVTNREALQNQLALKRYNSAVCAAAEVIYRSLNENSKKQSETVGNHSVTYKIRTAQEIESEKRRNVLLYLRGTGLCYSAMTR